VRAEVGVAGYQLTVRRMAWPNVLLVGGAVGILIVSFLLLLSLIRSYVEPPKIPAARPLLAATASTPVELTGFTAPTPSHIEYAWAAAMKDLAASKAPTSPPAIIEEPVMESYPVPLPPRRPRTKTFSALSDNVPMPRPRPRD
jgi:hypothetical protein